MIESLIFVCVCESACVCVCVVADVFYCGSCSTQVMGCLVNLDLWYFVSVRVCVVVLVLVMAQLRFNVEIVILPWECGNCQFVQKVTVVCKCLLRLHLKVSYFIIFDHLSLIVTIISHMMC